MSGSYAFLVAGLGVWRVTHLLQAEDGPWGLVARLRRRLGAGFLGGLVDCFYCLSLWIAAPFAWAVGHGTAERWLLWPALSGAAILLERAFRAPALAASFAEDPPGEGGAVANTSGD